MKMLEVLESLLNFTHIFYLCLASVEGVGSVGEFAECHTYPLVVSGKC